MKRIYLMGVIALLAMVLAVPVMADNPSDSVVVNGSILQVLSIDSSIAELNFGDFTVGDNEEDNIGTLTITSEFIPSWTVTASMSDGYGHLRSGAGAPVTGTYLTNKLEQYNYQNSTWLPVQGFSFSGSASTSMSESFRQNVLITDLPGSYSTVITYTVTVP